MIDWLICDRWVRATMECRVLWVRWERTGNVDPEAMLDLPGLKEFQGRR